MPFGNAMISLLLTTSRIYLMTEDNYHCHLANFSGFSITGDDAKTFLQGQLTCDLEDVGRDGIRLAAHCNLKGRVVSLFFLIKAHDGYVAILPNSNLDTAITHLKKYAMFSKVSIESLDETYHVIGAGGNTELDTIETNTGPIPQAVWSATHDETNVIAKLPSQSHRYLIVSKANLPNDSEPTTWLLDNILECMPMVTAETAEAFLPQMLNLEQHHGLSFTKGCFIGQEVIARTHHLGKLKQKTYIISIKTESPVNLGTKIQSEGKDIGSIIECVKSEGSYHALAVLRTQVIESGPSLSLEADETASIQLI